MSRQNAGPELNNPSPGLSEAAVLEMLPAYVLGSLELDEMLAVDDFIAAQPSLLARVAELEAAADQLALAAPQADPPATAKAGLMARVQADAGVRAMLAAMGTPPAAASAPPAPSRPSPLATPRPAPSRPSPLAAPLPPEGWLDRLRRFLGGNFFWPALAAGTLAALLVVAVYAAQSGIEATRSAAALAAAQAQIALLQNQSEELRQINQQLQEQLSNDRNQLAIFSNADRVVALAGTPDAPNASGAFYSGPENGLLVLRGLPPLPSDQTYELWLIPGAGNPIPAGLVQVAADGSNTFTIALADQPSDFAAVGLSIEPAAGSPAPTGPIVLLGKVG